MWLMWLAQCFIIYFAFSNMGTYSKVIGTCWLCEQVVVVDSKHAMINSRGYSSITFYYIYLCHHCYKVTGVREVEIQSKITKNRVNIAGVFVTLHYHYTLDAYSNAFI